MEEFTDWVNNRSKSIKHSTVRIYSGLLWRANKDFARKIAHLSDKLIIKVFFCNNELMTLRFWKVRADELLWNACIISWGLIHAIY